MCELLLPSFIQTYILCYQPSCHNCLHVAIVLKICGLQDAVALEAYDCRSATNPHDIITTGVGSVITEFYATKAYFLTGLPISEEE
jgi:hypothetical protein